MDSLPHDRLARMTVLPMKIPKSKTALVAIRQCGEMYEAFDGEGVSLGSARTPTQLWTLLGLAMASVKEEIKLPTPEEVALEDIVRATGASVGGFIEERNPGFMKLAKTFLRGATIARQKGLFED